VAKAKTRLTAAQWKALELRHAAGESLGSIARSLDVDVSYFCKLWKRRNLPKPDRAFIPGNKTGTVSPAPPPSAPPVPNTKPKIWEVR